MEELDYKVVNYWGVRSESFLILQQDKLKELGKYLSNFSIYTVVTVPKIEIVVKRFKQRFNRMYFTFLIHDKGVKRKKKVVLKEKDLFGHSKIGKIKIQSEYPFNIFKLITKNGTVLYSNKILIFLTDICKVKIDMNILYIGKSNKRIDKRLEKHERLQQIYSENLNNYLDREVWIILWQFSSPEVSTKFFNGISTQGEAAKKLKKAHCNQVTKEKRINCIEAAMINYFKPKYNKVYKENFVNIKHKEYNEIFSLGYDSIQINLGLDERFRLYSKVKKASESHEIYFNFNEENKEKNYFEELNLFEK